MLYSDKDERIEGNRKNYLYLSKIYAHGLLENMLGYDILMTNSIELYNDIYNYHHEGDQFIRKCKVDDNKGNIYDVTMFLWKHKQWKTWQGLVCLDNDDDSIKDALEKYENKVEDL